MEISKEILEFGKNDWRQIAIQEKKEPKNGYTPRYKAAIDYIKEKYPDVPFSEASFIVKNNLQGRRACLNCGSFNVFRRDPQPTYQDYCSRKCRSAGLSNSAGESIIVDGVRYSDFAKAIESLNLSRYHIRQRIFDPKFPNYKWDVDDHDAKCIEKLKESHPRMADRSFFESWKSSKKSREFLSNELGLSADTIKCALTYFEIDTSFDQINENAIELKNDPERLRELYENHTSDEIANMFDVSPSAILQWLKYHDIEIDKSKSQSAIERHLIEYIKSLDPSMEVIDRDRNHFGFEVDIFIPSKSLAIECDGIFYHSELPTSANRNKHSYKQIECNKKNVTLLRFVDVNETGSKDKLEIVKSIISSKLGYTNRIHARKCELVVVPSHIGVAFFKENHISGNRGASIYYGLQYEGELMMCMSFGRPIMSRSHEWEIIRMASKKMTTVVGGASKIFKHFLKNHSGSVMSYANLRFGSGNVYESLGMIRIGETGPGYSYTDCKTIYSRHKFQKASIKAMCPLYDSTKTEAENAEANGYRVYWDCGHAIYELIR